MREKEGVWKGGKRAVEECRDREQGSAGIVRRPCCRGFNARHETSILEKGCCEGCACLWRRAKAGRFVEALPGGLSEHRSKEDEGYQQDNNEGCNDGASTWEVAEG